MSENKKQGSKHDLEHEYWSRRSFMQTLGIASVGSMMLGSKVLAASKPSLLSYAISNSENDNILILIRLSGGNDGLNTIVPLNQHGLYANARPNIYIPENKVLKLTDEYGVPDHMKFVEKMWGEGQFKAVHAVGMQRQSLSHFTGSEIWSNADINTTSFEGETTGWMGRYLEDKYPDYLLNPPNSPAAIQVGNYGDLLFSGEEIDYAFTTSNVTQLEKIATSGLQYQVEDRLFDECTYDKQLKFLRGMANTTYQYSGVINEAYKLGKNQVEYTNNDFAKQLAIIARLIKGGLKTKVFMITLGGFDTHANQPVVHKKLMTTLTDAIGHFYDDLKFTGHDQLVLGMTYSEFGRRIFENGSRGTDHGKAAPMLLFGGGLNGSGFVGNHPNLNDDVDSRGNLEHEIDFRDVYASILEQWMCVPVPMVEEFLLGYKYRSLNLGITSCRGVLSTEENVIKLRDTTHKLIYKNNFDPYILLELSNNSYVKVDVLDLNGQKIATVFDESVFQNKLEIELLKDVGTSIASGIYIYAVEVNTKRFTKKFIVK